MSDTMNEHDRTANDTAHSGNDPIRPAHYRDPDTGRDRIAVWREAMLPDDFLAAIAATVDRYLSRAGRKPGVPAEQDYAKAAEVVRRYYEEWGEGADELLGEFLGDLGHDREAIDVLLRAADQPRAAAAASTTPAAPTAATSDAPQRIYLQWHGDASADEPATAPPRDTDVTWTRERVHPRDVEYVRADSTPPAAVTPQQAAGARPLPTREQGADDARETALRLERESKCPEATLAALLAGEDATHVDDGSIRSEFERVRAEYREALRRIEQPRGVTPQQAAGARPLPATPRQLVLGNGAVAMHVGTVGDDTHPRMLLLYSVEPGPIGHEDEVGMRPSALPAGASVMPDDPRLDVLIYCGRRESAEMLRDTVQEIIDKWPREEGDDPQAAQDDHAAALHPTRHQVSFALSALSDALGAAEEAGNQYVVDAVNAATEALEDVEAQQDAERERERADRAERALRELVSAGNAHRFAHTKVTQRDRENRLNDTVDTRIALRNANQALNAQKNRLEAAIDAAHAAITAQRSDDTARDDGDGSAAGEGEVAP